MRAKYESLPLTTLKDIARDLDLSVPAAKSRLLRARRRLKEVLVKGGLADDTVG